jgi:hypothetical protein
MRRKKLTFEDHQRLSRLLRGVRHGLFEVLSITSGCGMKTRIDRELMMAIKKVDRVRSRLEDLMFIELPEQADIFIYYPGQIASEVEIFVVGGERTAQVSTPTTSVQTAK